MVSVSTGYPHCCGGSKISKVIAKGQDIKIDVSQARMMSRATRASRSVSRKKMSCEYIPQEYINIHGNIDKARRSNTFEDILKEFIKFAQKTKNMTITIFHAPSTKSSDTSVLRAIIKSGDDVIGKMSSTLKKAGSDYSVKSGGNISGEQFYMVKKAKSNAEILQEIVNKLGVDMGIAQQRLLYAKNHFGITPKTPDMIEQIISLDKFDMKPVILKKNYVYRQKNYERDN